jgi:hypothetical protein
MKGDSKKDFNYIWDIIEIPVIIIVLYSLIDLAFSTNLIIDKLFPSWIFGTALTFFAFGLIGYKTVMKEKNPTPGKYGAYAGLITGFITAIIGIITFYFFPERIAEALQQAAQSGADVSTVETFMKIGIYINLVLSPALSAGIGALIAFVSGMIFKKK